MNGLFKIELLRSSALRFQDLFFMGYILEAFKI